MHALTTKSGSVNSPCKARAMSDSDAAAIFVWSTIMNGAPAQHSSIRNLRPDNQFSSSGAPPPASATAELTMMDIDSDFFSRYLSIDRSLITPSSFDADLSQRFRRGYFTALDQRWPSSGCGNLQ
jgi:hypothetical protein